MRNQLWYELVNIKYGEVYLTKYLGLQRLLKRCFKITTLLLSLSGILGWKFFEDIVWIALLLIAIIQLFTLIENQLIRSDNEIEQISGLKIMYIKYLNKLEKLWSSYSSNQISTEESTSVFFNLKDEHWTKIEEQDNKLNIKKWPFLMRKTENETKKYIKYYYYE